MDMLKTHFSIEQLSLGPSCGGRWLDAKVVAGKKAIDFLSTFSGVFVCQEKLQTNSVRANVETYVIGGFC